MMYNSAEEMTDTEKADIIKKAKSKKSVYIYITTLFLIVFFFILLSYFMQQRNNSELHTLNEQNATAQQNIENLQTTNQVLQKENDTYKIQVSELTDKVESLEVQAASDKNQLIADFEIAKNNDIVKYSELLAKYNELIEKYGVKVDKND